MTKRLSCYSFDELLFLPKRELKKLLKESVDDIRRILDPDGKLQMQSKPKNRLISNLIEFYDEADC